MGRGGEGRGGEGRGGEGRGGEGRGGEGRGGEGRGGEGRGGEGRGGEGRRGREEMEEESEGRKDGVRRGKVEEYTKLHEGGKAGNKTTVRVVTRVHCLEPVNLGVETCLCR